MEQGARRHRFDVFLSYSRTDLRFARWLEGKLEGYRPPKGIEASRLNVFRDEHDLVGNQLGPALEGALLDSGALLVVCSPAARASHWVDLEISTYVERYGERRVFPVLLGGLPTGDGPHAAFPDALVRSLPNAFAADFRPEVDRKLRRESLLTVLAFLYGCDKERLAERERGRTRRRVSLGVGLGVAVAGSFGGYALLEKQRRGRLEQGAADELTRVEDDAARRVGVAENRDLAKTLARSAVGTNERDLALLLAAEALLRHDTREVRQAAIEVLERTGGTRVLDVPTTPEAVSDMPAVVTGLAWSGDGAQLWAADEIGAVVAIAAATGKQLGTSWTTASDDFRAAISEANVGPVHGKRLLAHDYARLFVVDTTSPDRPIGPWTIPGGVQSVAWHEDGRVVAVLGNRHLELRRAEDGHVLSRHDLPARPWMHIASHDGELWGISYDDEYFRYASGDASPRTGELAGEGRMITSVLDAAHARLLYVRSPGVVWSLSLRNGASRRVTEIPGLQALSFSSRGRSACAVTKAGDVLLLESDGARLVELHRTRLAGVNSYTIAMHPIAKTCAVADDTRAHLVDLVPSNLPSRDVAMSGQRVWSMRFSNDSSELRLLTEDCGLYSISTPGGERARQIVPSRTDEPVALGSSGDAYACRRGPGVTVWRRDGSSVGGPWLAGERVAISPSGATIAWADGAAVVVADATTGTEVARLHGGLGPGYDDIPVNAIDFSSEDRMSVFFETWIDLYSGPRWHRTPDRAIAEGALEGQFDAAVGREQAQIIGASGLYIIPLTSSASAPRRVVEGCGGLEPPMHLSNSGRWALAGCGSDMSLIDVESARALRLPIPLPQGSAAVSNDGLRIAMVDEDLLLFDLDAGSLRKQACEAAGRTMTNAERTRYLPGRDEKPACAAVTD